MDDKKIDVPGMEGLQDDPSVDQPLHGPKRPVWMPLLMTVGFLAALALLYFLGMTFLVSAD